MVNPQALLSLWPAWRGTLRLRDTGLVILACSTACLRRAPARGSAAGQEAVRSEAWS